MLTGNFPVHDAPPIKVLVSGFLGTSGADASTSVPPLLAGGSAFFSLLGKVLTSPKTTLLSISFEFEETVDFFELPPRPTLFGILQISSAGLKQKTGGSHEGPLGKVRRKIIFDPTEHRADGASLNVLASRL